MVRLKYQYGRGGEVVKKIVIIAFVMGLLAGCRSDTQAISLIDQEGTLIGNNSGVTTIVNALENGGSVEMIELQTKAEPYGLAVQYDNASVGETGDWMLENAVKSFILIDNVEMVDINVGSETYSYSKEKLEEEYEKDFDDVTTEKEWEEVNGWIN
ncbi:DUF4825 domain-containing protein [Salimicrobium flavidum]|uniref:DUF4825 domain-containing protein n=1 Tax=Salimicrobium flavidum TaxID=570947 RepID=A0A1N7J8N3_9BACI|nr:DUF4825 domain-containing protein [Salimicrobium flavidum]SIS45596.1 protein of unknown function [Salimicrobium flavidum]